MTNVQNSTRVVVVYSSFRFCHYLVIMVSSFVIRTLILAIRVYQLAISPLLTFLIGPGGGCRFTPSCSQYAVDAIRAHGAVTGGWLAFRRICRCHPWGDCGHDPAPEKEFRI